MEKIVKNNFWGYSGRFILVHLITYFVIAVVFLSIQRALPVSQRVVLDFFRIYRSPDLTAVTAQTIRAGVMALVLYPFYEIIIRNKGGWLVLFGALWGLALLGSLEPFPGSIEGMIYTRTTAVEHLLVVAAGAVQVMFFCWLFLKWEHHSNSQKWGEIHG